MLKDIIIGLMRLTGRILRLILVDLPLGLIGLILVSTYLILNAYKNGTFSKTYTGVGATGSCVLPNCLKWFDCADLYSKFNRNPSTYLIKVLPEGTLYRIYWLCIRNPLNYFSYNYYAIIPKKSIITRKCIIWTQDYTPPGTVVSIGDSTNDMAGFQYVEYTIDGGTYYEYYLCIRYPDVINNLFSGNRKCFRARLGWKLGLPEEVKYEQAIQDVLNINPFASYSGK